MARKKKHEEPENHERWLVSYADFITLLFAFFVVMYSVSSVNEGKYRVLSDALLAAFRSPQKTLQPIQIGSSAKSPQSNNLDFRNAPNIISAPNLPLPDVARKNNGGGVPNPLAELADHVEAALSRLIDEDLIAVRFEDNYVEIEIKSNILFPSGGTKLTRDARKILIKLAKVLRNFPNFMRIEGHTDNTAMRSKAYASNWVLSAARAASVVDLFSKNGIEPERMSAVGYAQYRPIADNDYPAGRNKNRRVSIIVINQSGLGEMREDLYLASMSKDGKPPQRTRVGPDGQPEWEPPRDVTKQPVTTTDHFPVVNLPMKITPSLPRNQVPSIDHIDQARKSTKPEKQGAR